MNLAKLIENPDNPQRVSDEDFARLVEKIRRIPHGLEIRPIAYVTDDPRAPGLGVVLGGNKRLRALKLIYGDSAECPDAWFRDITSLTPDERREFIINDNTNEGEWDPEKLLAQYSADELGALMGGDSVEDLLASIETDTAGGGEDKVPLDDGKAGDTKQDEIVASFGSVKVPMTPKELELITAKYYTYVKEHQVGYGFILSLMEVSRNG